MDCDAIADVTVRCNVPAPRTYIFQSHAGIGTLLRHIVRWKRTAKSGTLIFCDQRSSFSFSVSPSLYLEKHLFYHRSDWNSEATASTSEAKKNNRRHLSKENVENGRIQHKNHYYIIKNKVMIAVSILTNKNDSKRNIAKSVGNVKILLS